MTQDALDKFFSDSIAYLSLTQPKVVNLLLPFCKLASPEGSRSLPGGSPPPSFPERASGHCPEHAVVTQERNVARRLKESPSINRLQRSASAVFLAVTLATMLGCAATSTRESTGQFVDDAAITAKVKAKILDRPTLKFLDIHVNTDKGVVHLWGVVGSQSIIDEAGRLASGVPGVKSVKNDLRLM